MQVLIQIIEIKKKLKLIILLNLGEANMFGEKKNLHLDYISSQYIIFLVQGNKLPILLIVEDDFKTYNKAMMS
jgi:hypothetical protein